MPENKIGRVLKTSIKGYRNFIQSFLSFSFLTIIFIIISIAAGALITYPFWAAAVNSPAVFTIIALSLTFAALVFAVARKLSLKNSRKIFLEKLLRFSIFLGKLLLISGALYGSIVLIRIGYWYLSIPLILMMIILLGLILNGKKKKSS